MKNFKVEMIPFDGAVHVWIGNLQEIAEDIEEKNPDLDMCAILQPGTLATTIKTQSIKGEGVVIVLGSDVPDNILWHECLHASWYVLELFGVNVNVDNHEILAYMQGYLASAIKKRLK